MNNISANSPPSAPLELPGSSQMLPPQAASDIDADEARSVDGAHLANSATDVHSGGPSGGIRRTQTQSSDEGLDDCSTSASASPLSTSSPPVIAVDAAQQLGPSSTSASAPASRDQPFNMGTTGPSAAASAAASADGAAGVSSANLLANNQLLEQKLKEAEQNFNRVMQELVVLNSQYKSRLSELGAHSRIVFVSFLVLTPMSLLILMNFEHAQRGSGARLRLRNLPTQNSTRKSTL